MDRAVSKSDLDVWIERFVKDISVRRSQKGIQKRCEDELIKLRQELEIVPNLDNDGIAQDFRGKVNTLHTYLTQYKNAVTEGISLTSRNSYEQTIGKFKSVTHPGSRRKVRFHFVHK